MLYPLSYGGADRETVRWQIVRAAPAEVAAQPTISTSPVSVPMTSRPLPVRAG